MAIDEDDLLARLRAGEEPAYRELVGACQGAMRAVARAIAGQRFADEVVQDAWLVALFFTGALVEPGLLVGGGIKATRRHGNNRRSGG